MGDLVIFLTEPKDPVRAEAIGLCLLFSEKLHHHPDGEADGEESDADGCDICDERHVVIPFPE